MLAGVAADFVFCFFQVMSQRNEMTSEVDFVGQRVTYSNRTFETEEDTLGLSSALIKPDFHESSRALKLGKG